MADTDNGNGNGTKKKPLWLRILTYAGIAAAILLGIWLIVLIFKLFASVLGRRGSGAAAGARAEAKVIKATGRGEVLQARADKIEAKTEAKSDASSRKTARATFRACKRACRSVPRRKGQRRKCKAQCASDFRNRLQTIGLTAEDRRELSTDMGD